SPRTQREWEHKERIREMAEAHGRHLTEIQARNRELEKQREEIHRRLWEFSSKDQSPSHVEQMLLELKAQEEKNQGALDALKEQLKLMQTDTVYPLQKKEEKVLFNPPTAGGNGSLSYEISALRLAYLQGGGNDPVILAQMYDLQMEAQILERKRKQELPHRALDAELLAVELENQRLEDEILKLKLQRERKKADDVILLSLGGTSHILKEKKKKILRKPPPYNKTNKPIPGWRKKSLPGTVPKEIILELLFIFPWGGAPGSWEYPPRAGFVIFYDFLLGLDTTLSLVRLVAGLYNNGQEMGKPTPLPAVYCEMGRAFQYVTDGHKGNYATLSTKQPVPSRVRPSSSISLVLELQAAGGFDPYGREIQRLVSRGWAKVDIFDQHNQVISGRWKVPVRALPVKPSLSTGQLNGVPQ
uniref:Coiled-coil domain containing 17 n=1 Tax=Latimeria chalumnae TaxID=7897 RepID=H3AXV0_LATCH